MKIQRTMSADEEELEEYATMVGDHNPLHVNREYAESDRTFTDGVIVHGTLIMGWFSGLLNDIGDSGRMQGQVILVNMNVDFENPLMAGDGAIVEAEVEPAQMPDDDTETVMLNVFLEAKSDSRKGHRTTYASGSAMIMVDQSVSQHEHFFD